VQRYEASLADEPEARVRYEQALKEWEKAAYFFDPGNSGFGQGWADAAHDAADWPEMTLPTFWEHAGLDIDGVVWFRKEVTIPADWAGKDLGLSLGAIDDTDTTYFNGVQVGETTMETPNWWQAPRRYTVPGKLAQAGRAVIAVRVYDRWMNGGFGGTPADMTLAPSQGSAAAIALAGPWRYKVEVSREQPKTTPAQPAAPMGRDNPWLPSGLYDAMLRPLVPYAIKGAIWYQGESNADRAYQYRRLFPAMIEDWRTAWGEGDFPFLFVQLANYLPVQQQASEDAAWPELREAQLMALSLPKTGMAVTTDVGEAVDIHPKNKQDVGHRLALAALGVAYGKSIVDSGPLFDHMEATGDRIALSFTHVGSGLAAAGGGDLKGFAIAGEDRRFVWADARIEGGKVIVSNKEVPKPVAVRYNWANNPVGNLYNVEGLPASPFRTDDWPGVTENNR
jgi:sialate O-acetylesterase